MPSMLTSHHLWHSTEGNFTGNAQEIYLLYGFEIGSDLKLQPHLPGTSELNTHQGVTLLIKQEAWQPNKFRCPLTA